MAQRNGFQILLLICLIPTSVFGQAATIIKPPDNVAQYVGDNVTLACEFQESNFELLWSECITAAPACTGLFRDSTPIPGATPPPRYSVVNRPGSSGKRYDFVITGVQSADGGQFRCDSTSITAPVFAEVIVLEADINCSNNLTSGSEVELGDFIHLSSDVTFDGRWPPAAMFKYADNTVPGWVDETSGNTAKYSVVLEAVKNLQGQTLSAEWYFNDIAGTATGEAINTPTFPVPNTCSSLPITVFYPPDGLTIDPIQESYHVGETITCTGQGNPAPGIQWINMNDLSVSVDCPTGGSCQLVVSEDWLGTTASYRCQPCNEYFSVERCISQDITFTTYITTTSSTTVPPPSTTREVAITSDPNMTCECEQDIPDGFFLLSTGGLAGIIVVCVLLLLGNVAHAILYWRKHGEGKNKDTDSASVGRDVTSPSYQNIATYVNVSGGARGAGGATPVTQPGSDPYVNVSGAARGAEGATPVTQPWSDPYAELGPIRDPPRRAEYDVLRLPAASDLDHDVTHNCLHG